MLKKKMQAYILQQINIHNKVLSSDLSVQMNVSEDTIRRDLQELDEQGKITKVHGGALSKAFHFTLQSNVVYQQTEKRMIAQKAIALLRDGMFILLSGGTTIVEMVKILPKELNVTFITVSLPVALELLNHPNCQVVFLGNLLSKNAQIAIGAEVVTRLNEITADICFLGTNSIDAEKGITDLEWEVIEVKKAMINSALKTVSLAISEKVNTVQRLQVCKLEAIHTLITELDSTDPRLAPYKEAGLQIL
ncbi:DeoR/GlpR family DNA-binding transcription regulator [Hydrotalea sp.]|uniref:DeoR/GlpR family DNA-binding transcription regulator n=1 Tax=Hydrotalea sp. TaxID=2881279 RepID=UPI0026088343|nr:DeoR/GlpR family DNA-binding transcription regulator [Hydrotalea sp.]